MSKIDRRYSSNAENDHTSIGRSATNLYIKNFGYEIDEGELCQLFKSYGRITSCRVSQSIVKEYFISNSSSFSISDCKRRIQSISRIWLYQF